MSKETQVPDEKKKDDVEELKIVGDGADPAPEIPEEKAAPTEARDDEPEEEERAGHAEGDEGSPEGETVEQKQARRRKERQDRRDKERRKSAELRFLRSRNEQLEKRFSTLETRQDQQEERSLTTQIGSLKEQIRKAENIHAAAVDEKDGSTATEALRIKSDLEENVRKLEGVKEARKTRKSESTEAPTVDPTLVRHAQDWVKKNSDWFDPHLRDEVSHLAKTIDDRMTNEGEFDPRTPEYWDELQKRVERRFPEIRKNTKMKARDDWGDDDDAEDERPSQRAARDDDDEPRPAKKTEAAAKKASGGPRFSVGGRERALGSNEVYIDAERRKALEDAGVWEDESLRKRYLQSYQRYDKEAAAQKRNRN